MLLGKSLHFISVVVDVWRGHWEVGGSALLEGVHYWGGGWVISEPLQPRPTYSSICLVSDIKM